MGSAGVSLTLSEAAGQLKVSARTVRREIADGKIRANRVGGKLLIEEDEFQRYRDACRYEALPKSEKKAIAFAWILGPNPAQDAALEPDSVRANKCRFPYSGPAVYFLYKGDEIVYVGQTNNLLRRVASHFGFKDFDHFSYIACRKEELTELERRAILKYRPKLNSLNCP